MTYLATTNIGPQHDRAKLAKTLEHKGYRKVVKCDQEKFMLGHHSITIETNKIKAWQREA